MPSESDSLVHQMMHKNGLLGDESAEHSDEEIEAAKNILDAHHSSDAHALASALKNWDGIVNKSGASEADQEGDDTVSGELTEDE